MTDALENSHTAPKFAAPDPDKMAKWYVANLGFPKHVVFDDGA